MINRINALLHTVIFLKSTEHCMCAVVTVEVILAYSLFVISHKTVAVSNGRIQKYICSVVFSKRSSSIIM